MSYGPTGFYNWWVKSGDCNKDPIEEGEEWLASDIDLGRMSALYNLGVGAKTSDQVSLLLSSMNIAKNSELPDARALALFSSLERGLQMHSLENEIMHTTERPQFKPKY